MLSWSLVRLVKVAWAELALLPRSKVSITIKLCELAMFTVVKVKSVKHNKIVQTKLAFIIGDDEVH